MSEEKKFNTEELTEKAKDFAEKAGKEIGKAAETAKAGAEKLFNAGKEALGGEDGKIAKDDVDRIAGQVKETASDLFNKGKDALLGEDGKFDKDDVTRIVDSVKETAKGAVDKAKGIFDKKGE